MAEVARRSLLATAMGDFRIALSSWADNEVWDEIGKFAVALRQSIVLGVPLVSGDIWSPMRIAGGR